MGAITSKGRPQLAGQQQAVLPPNPTREDILNALVEKRIDTQRAAQELAKLDKPAQRLSCKVSEKGAVSVYGLQRMPVTLYAGQWERLAEFMPEIVAFIQANNGKLSRK